jgi:hypothetical protein
MERESVVMQMVTNTKENLWMAKKMDKEFLPLKMAINIQENSNMDHLQEKVFVFIPVETVMKVNGKKAFGMEMEYYNMQVR